MAKTKPIGVRFDEDLLAVFKEDKIAETPQKTLNYLTWFYSKYKAGREGNIDFTETVKGSKLFDKKSETKKETKEETATPDNSELLKQIEAIRAEIKPSFFLKADWERNKLKRISELELKLLK